MTIIKIKIGKEERNMTYQQRLDDIREHMEKALEGLGEFYGEYVKRFGKGLGYQEEIARMIHEGTTISMSCLSGGYMALIAHIIEIDEAIRKIDDENK